jgi:integrase
MRKALTTVAIKNIVPKPSRQEIPDGHAAARGLYLVVQPSGAMSWAFRYELAGRSRKLTLGAYPGLTIGAARDAVGAALAKLAKWIDIPGAEKTEAAHKATVAQLCDQYLKEWVGRRNKARTATENRRYCDSYIRPGLGKRFVADVSIDDIEHFLDNVLNRRFAAQNRKVAPTAPVTANRVRTVLSKMFELAEKRFGMRPQSTNPVKGVSRNPEHKRRRLAGPAELERLAEALDHYAGQYPRQCAGIWTLMLCGARVNEVAQATSDEWRGDRLRKAEHKTAGKIGAKEILLPPQAVELLKQIEPDPSGYLFGQGNLRPLWERIRERAGCPDLQLRDARRTFASAAKSAGRSLDQIGEMLHHTTTATTRGYSWLFEETKRAAVNDTADILSSLMRPSGR